MKESFIKHYRTLLGISQQELAEHLRISRSQLAMAESGRRQLPTAPYMALMELIQLYENVASEPVSVVPSEADYADLCVSLAKDIQELQWEIAQAEHTLGKMVEHYQVGIRQQRLFIHILRET